MFSKPLLAFATLATANAAKSALTADTGAFASTDGCARCVLKGQYWQYTASTSERSTFTTVALAKASGTCASSTNTGAAVELNYTNGSNYMELLIGACPYAQDICTVTNQSGATSISNMLTLDEAGKTGTLTMTGGTDGTKLTTADGYCVWLIKATCGAPGFTINETKTVMAGDASYKLYVVEYSKEFTTSAAATITLEDSDWFPKGLTSIAFYDNAAITSGIAGSLAYADGTGAVYNIAGGALAFWNSWTEATYDVYFKDLATYEASITTFNADKTTGRPVRQPAKPTASAVPVTKNTEFTQGLGKPTSQLVTGTMKGKSFGVTAGTPTAGTDSAALGVRFRREGTSTAQTTKCDDSYLLVGAIMEVAGSSTNKILQLDVKSNQWAGNITPTFKTLTDPTALPAKPAGASIMQATGIISAASLAAFTLF